MKTFILTYLILLLSTNLKSAQIDETKDYLQYHKQIIEAEKLIGEENFKAALSQYENVFDTYEFVFLRDYQVAAQLALFLNDKQKALHYVKEGISAGWELKAIKKNKYLSQLNNEPEWKSIVNDYDSLRKVHNESLNQPIRNKAKKMFSKDQRKAFGALLKIGDKAQQKYAERKFAPHSERQVFELIEILESAGYPGEKLIGNRYWISTILSHHNSISTEYVKKDTLYTFLKPRLFEALRNGQMSPYEYATIDDWHRTVVSDRKEPGYGFLIAPTKTSLSVTNELRQIIGLRPIEVRNKLVDVEQRTGMNFYLPGNPWVRGNIEIKD
ncbi:hypothetical protein [Cecembia rubra]|nr:hypothetical protein [Cecembia rubra]